MNEHTLILIDKNADIDTVVTILARNGYTVRQFKKKATETGKTVRGVEFWKEG